LSFYLVSFGKPRFLGVVDIDRNLQKGTYIVVESARGLELALNLGGVSPDKVERYREKFSNVSQDESPQLKGSEPLFQDLIYVREAEALDLSESTLQREEEEKVLLDAREILKGHKLPMKLVEAEYLLDRKKLFFFFTSEQRVDFRAFVKDLARKFKTRIELRQIGVRDEAKVVKGLGPCGRPCCCGYWLNTFEPICIRMVKEQNLSLNPAKTSGICGRLMCCIAYERETYSKLWERLPNPGSKIKGPDATYVISGVDITSDCVKIIEPGKGEILVPVDKFEAFRECVERGEVWSDFQVKPLIEIEPIEEEPEFSWDDNFEIEVTTGEVAQLENQDIERKKVSEEMQDKENKTKNSVAETLQDSDETTKEGKREGRRKRSKRKNKNKTNAAKREGSQKKEIKDNKKKRTKPQREQG